MNSICLSPPNAILFIFDPSNKAIEVPAYIDSELVASNSTCVSVGTQASVDGDTEVTLETNWQGREVGLIKVFDGAIETPNHQIAVSTAELDLVLQKSVSDAQSRVIIWSDDIRNPSRIVITIIESAGSESAGPGDKGSGDKGSSLLIAIPAQ